MNFSIRELNELIYSLGTTASKGMFCDKELNASLLDKLHAELKYKLSWEIDDTAWEDEIIEQEVKRFDSNGFTNIVTNKDSEVKRKGVTQTLLDYVEFMGDATYTEMHKYYRDLFGSNSFSHILKALKIPYKNRPTRRYLRKNSNGKYVVEIANPQNWVIVQD